MENVLPVATSPLPLFVPSLAVFRLKTELSMVTSSSTSKELIDEVLHEEERTSPGKLPAEHLGRQLVWGRPVVAMEADAATVDPRQSTHLCSVNILVHCRRLS